MPIKVVKEYDIIFKTSFLLPFLRDKEEWINIYKRRRFIFRKSSRIYISIEIDSKSKILFITMNT